MIEWLLIHVPFFFWAMSWFGPGWCCPPVCACRVPKSQCVEEEGPCEYGLLIEGIVNGQCVGCSDINGTYILTESATTNVYRYDGVWSAEWPNLTIRVSGSCFNWTAGGVTDVFRLQLTLPIETTVNGTSRLGRLFIGDTAGVIQDVTYQNRNYPANESPFPCLTTEDMTDFMSWVPSVSPGPSCNLSGAYFESWPI